MNPAAQIVIMMVALLHFWFLILEMFLWNKPTGHRIFRLTPEFAAASRSLAANQGLYNGFLAAGLLWGISMGSSGNHITVFFLGCVIVAGVFGAITVNPRIFWIQAMPAIIALVLLAI